MKPSSKEILMFVRDLRMIYKSVLFGGFRFWWSSRSCLWGVCLSQNGSCFRCVGCEFYLTWLWMCWSIDLCIDRAVLGGLCFPARAIYEWFSPFTSLIFQSTLDLMTYCWFFKSDWLLCTTVVLISPHSAMRISANSLCISSVCSFMLKTNPSIQQLLRDFSMG